MFNVQGSRFKVVVSEDHPAEVGTIVMIKKLIKSG